MTKPENIPTDIIADIMARLSAKPIIRFKSVCKSWRELFSEPHFVQMHLDRTMAKGNTSLLLRHKAPEEKASYNWKQKRTRVDVTVDEMGNQTVTHITARHFEENFSLRSCADLKEVISKPQLPIHWRRRFTLIVGSNHGIVCIAENDNDFNDVDAFDSLDRFPTNEHLALWNPATTELQPLPKLAKGRSYSHTSALGFTYNPDLNDYQVVLSLSTNRWREVDSDSLECLFYDFVSKVNLGGTLHWLAYDGDGDIILNGYIVYLDTTKDEFGTFEFPEQISTERKEALLQSYCVDPAEKKESLLLFVYDCLFSPGCDVWLMQEYGNQTSWTMLYSIPLMFMMHPIGNHHGHESEILAGILKDDDAEEGHFYALCTRRLSFKNFRARTPTCIFKHMETLVSIARLQGMLPGSLSSAPTGNA
ncbi:F-box protein CPR1 [Linum grandiflorum]